MTAVARTLLSAKIVYPALAIGLLSVILGLQYCPAAARAAPDFSLPVVSATSPMSGDRMRLADQRGHVVVLDFWATWCRPCQISTPGLVRIAHRFRDRGVVVMGVNVDDGGPESVPAFMRHFAIDYPVLYDDGTAQSRYGIHALPTAVLIDKQGRIRRVHQGVTDESDLADQIQGLL